MKLVFIYGPPAVGKLTVAKELAALTGFKVFHNQVILPDRGQFGKLASVEKLRDILGKWDLFCPVPFGEHLCIDTSCIEPAEAARMIMHYYDLQGEGMQNDR